mmetsp:Transcript_31111/g.67094  ORF Transcript_31111/g.67094 Transcript_31111/m.67094 type:complete len:292 (+) Transcript_31111:658-1533(+)
MLQHVLNNVVAIGILGQDSHIAEDLLKHRLQLVRHTVLQESLDHPATVHMPSGFFRFLLHCSDDEIDRIWRHLLDAFLNNMVSVHVPYAVVHVIFQLPGDLLLRLFGDSINRLLDDSATTLVLRQFGHIALQSRHHGLPLLCVSRIKDLLHQVVAVGVLCQVWCFSTDSSIDSVLRLLRCLIQLLLDVSSAVLVLGKFSNQVLLKHLFQRHFSDLPSHLVELCTQGVIVFKSCSWFLLGILSLGTAFAFCLPRPTVFASSLVLSSWLCILWSSLLWNRRGMPKHRHSWHSS